MEPIGPLEVGFVPHRLWPLRKWYFASPLWFYHRPYAVDEMIPTPQFYDLVDAELRPLCKGLHEAGIHTTPSCQGHFYGRDRFEAVWDELSEEQSKIRADGLVVQDSETEEQFLFQDADYRMPWETFEQFFAAVTAQQGVGYIGILVPVDRDDLRARLGELTRHDDQVHIEFDDAIGRKLNAHLLTITTTPRTRDQRAAAWRRITDDVLARVHDPALA